MIFLDGARFLDEAVRSVTGQLDVDDWELILVDDGSTDGSSDLARRWADADPTRIRYVEHTGHANRGMSASRNLGLQVATGDYVTFLDSDDVWLPSALAHRMRVATAHPRADVVVGGTWRWHSWTGDPADRDLDVPMPLPLAPAYTTLEPPQLLHAVYGVEGGGHVPAMCSLLIRREALLAIGGLVADFRDLYEDQVLYVKMGLHLRAVLDPRPLALYRQHPASACSVAVSSGAWNPWQANEPGARFFEWMRDYVGREAGPGSPELDIVERNIAHIRARATERWYSPRPLARRLAPRWVHQLVHRLRTGPRAAPPTILQRWSEQFLGMAAATMAGDVLVASPAAAADPWTASVPGEAFRAATRVTRQSLLTVADQRRFDHVVVPWAAAQELAPEAVLSAVHRVLRPGGSAAVVLPGRCGAPSPAAPRTTANDLRVAAAARFPSHDIAVEAFGNPETAAAVAGGHTGGDVGSASVDWHDGRTEVLLTLLAVPCVRS